MQPPFSRRDVLKKIGLALAAGAAGSALSLRGGDGAIAAGAVTSTTAGSVAPLSYAHFASLVGTSFTVTKADGGRVALELAEAVADRADHGGESFRLRFSGAAGTALGEQTYVFQHAALGSLEIFIAPSGERLGAACWNAVFNCLPATA